MSAAWYDAVDGVFFEVVAFSPLLLLALVAEGFEVPLLFIGLALDFRKVVRALAPRGRGEVRGLRLSCFHQCAHVLQLVARGPWSARTEGCGGNVPRPLSVSGWTSGWCASSPLCSVSFQTF